MSKKSEHAMKLLEQIELPHGVPAPMEAGSLLEQGVYVILLRYLPPPRAEAGVQALAKAFDDWNEVRVSQAQEVAIHIAPRTSRTPDKLRKHLPAAHAVKEFLQEVFQKTHGLDLAELRVDPASAGKLIGQMPFLGSVGGAFLLWLAHERELPVTTGLVRVLDRLGLMARTTSAKKARVAMEPLMSKVEPLAFATAFGYVAEQWCLARGPICWECPLRDDCPHGKKVYRDWKAQQERLALQRQKEEARRVAQELKERAREERERKRITEAHKRQQEREARAAERRKATDSKGGAKDKKKTGGSKARPAAAKAAEKAGGARAGEKKPADKRPQKKAAAAGSGQGAAKPRTSTGSPSARRDPGRAGSSKGSSAGADSGSSAGSSRKPATSRKPAARKKTIRRR